MEIHFCDLCNESVPQSDLERGRAFIRKGRVVCLSCEQAMSAEEASQAGSGAAGTSALVAQGQDPGATPRAESRLGSGPPVAPWPREAPALSAAASSGLWLAVVALLFSAAAAAFLGEHAKSLRTEVGQLGTDQRLASQLSDQRYSVIAAQSEAERNALQSQLSQSSERQDTAIAQALEQARASSSDMAQRFEALTSELAQLRGDLTRRGERHDTGMSELSGLLANLEEDLTFHADRIARLELALENGVEIAAAGDAGGAGEAGSGRTPAWQGLVSDLASPNAGIRWEAVDALGQTRDPAVVEHLVPMLKDVDLFVRMATARVLGDLEAMVAVGDLIDALEDPEAAMREAAVVSLRAISGQNFRFDPLAKESEREKRVKSWRAWWKKISPSQPSAP